MEDIPQEFDVWLIDKDVEVTFDLRQRNTYSIVTAAEANPKRLTILVGKQYFVHEKLGDIELVPDRYELSQNFPNPFNPVTTIRYALPVAAPVNLQIYNVRGQKVRTLAQDMFQNPGYHTVLWDGRDQFGTRVASGLYFYVLQVSEPSSGEAPVFVQARKMVLVE
jgi:flagellar hook assembly protein FlgD